MTKSSVVIAGPEYERGVLHLCKLLYEENGVLSVNFDKVREHVRCALFQETSPNFPMPGLIGVIGDPELPEAAICLRVGDLWYSDEWSLQDVFNFVHPGFRRTDHARDLIAFAKDCAVRMKLPLFMGVVSTERTEAKCRLFQRLLPKVGEIYIYRGETPAVGKE